MDSVRNFNIIKYLLKEELNPVKRFIMTIEVFYQEDVSGKQLSEKLRKELEAHQLSADVMEVHDPGGKRFADLPFGPAIRVFNRFILHDAHSSIDNTVEKVINLVLGHCTSWILVPVDFTPESFHALRYAHRVAMNLGMGITIAYIHQPVIDVGIVGDFDGEMKWQERDQLAHMVSRLAKDQVEFGSSVALNVYFDTGDVSTHMHHLVKQEQYRLIILGPSSKAFRGEWQDGVVASAIRDNKTKPVMLVPIEAPLHFPKKLLIGLSDDLFTEDTFRQLSILMDSESVDLEFLHVGNDLIKFNDLQVRLTNLMTVDNRSPVTYDVNRVHSPTQDVEVELLTYTDLHGKDLLVVANSHRSFFRRLTHHSVSKAVSHHSHIPIMILHGEVTRADSIVPNVFESIR